MFQLLVSQL